MSIVAFFSSRDEFDVLKSRSDFNEIKLIALTPEADFSLRYFPERRKTIEDYYDEKELNIVGNNSLEKVNEICQSIDAEFFNENKSFSCSDVYMFLKVLYDQLLINHTFCSAVLKEENPKEIMIFNQKPLSFDFLAESYDDLLVNSIAYFFGDCEGIPITVLFSNKKERLSRMPALLGLKARFRKFLSKGKFEFISMLYRVKNKRKNEICFIQHYDFFVSMEIRKHFEVFFLKDKQTSLGRELDIDLDFNSIKIFFEIGGRNYFNLIQCKIENLINKVSPTFVEMVKYYAEWMLKKNIKAVIAASGQSLYILAGIKAAKLNNIPVIWGQHGGLYGYGEFPVMEYLHKDYSHYFVYSEGCSSINNYMNCFVVSDTKLRSLYKMIRLTDNAC